MNERIQRHLDGEGASGGLDARDRAEADAWHRMLEAFRVDAPPTTGAPPWLEDRVMAEIATLPERGPLRRAWQWFVRPAPVRVSPLAAGLVAAAFALVALLPGRSTPDAAGPPTAEGVLPASVDGEAVVYVQFVLEAPDARAVAVAGDFSDWEPSFALEDADGDGVWTGRVPVRPGVHAYMFLVDEAQWRTDPRAERYQDDGFGNRNAVVAVTAGA
jgi:hypothetical protein